MCDLCTDQSLCGLNASLFKEALYAIYRVDINNMFCIETIWGNGQNVGQRPGSPRVKIPTCHKTNWVDFGPLNLSQPNALYRSVVKIKGKRKA